VVAGLRGGPAPFVVEAAMCEGKPAGGGGCAMLPLSGGGAVSPASRGGPVEGALSCWVRFVVWEAVLCARAMICDRSAKFGMRLVFGNLAFV
jgi:hypothetical protein